MMVWFVLVVAVTWVVLFGFGRWMLDRAALSSGLARARARTPSPPYDHDEIRALPAPVARYFETALTPGRAFIEGATLFEEGTLRTSPENVLRFRAITRVTVRRPGFISESRIAGPFGLRVIDAYVDGQGSLDVAVFAGALRLQRLRRRQGLAEAQLQRWLAEAPWYPTALLPRAGVTWEAVDDRNARATVTDGLNSASLLFRFGNDGLVESVFADARGRDVRGTMVMTPWEGRFANPVERFGCVIPREGTASWLPPGSAPEPYWKGTLIDVRYD